MIASPQLWLKDSFRLNPSRDDTIFLPLRRLGNLSIARSAVTCRLNGIGAGASKGLEHMAANLAATLVIGVTIGSSTFLVADFAHALDRDGVEVLFQRSCVGCHVAGGNILQTGATLKAADLQRNGVSSVDDIFTITYSGKGRMPGFGEQCAPRGQCTFGPRLSDKDIRALAEFVRLQADQGWPNAQ